jgi:NadR type nicotinamide-nucleotide adenylyltransferase
MKERRIKKVVIIGPESTGKSTLCQQLAAHYNTLWCEEYAREYLVRNGTHYTNDDLLAIAERQLRLEEKYTRQALQAGKELLFIDTDMYVMKVWSEFVFNQTHAFILQQIEERKYDLYLLCNIDLPWVKDELREYPSLETRQELFNIYHDIMQQQRIPWTLIEGDYEQRLQSAIRAVDSLLL